MMMTTTTMMMMMTTMTANRCISHIGDYTMALVAHREKLLGVVSMINHSLEASQLEVGTCGSVHFTRIYFYIGYV